LKKDVPGRQSPYQLEQKVPDALRARVVELLRRGCAAENDAKAMKELAVVLSVAYPYAAFALRYRLWDGAGRRSPEPRFDAVPVTDARVIGYERGHDYRYGALAEGPGPAGLDALFPVASVDELRKRMRSETDVYALSSYADELDKNQWPIAAETIRTKANFIKREVGLSGRVVASTYRLDHNLPADVRSFVEWSLDNNRRPEQLEAIALHYGRGYAWTAYQLRHRASQLRVGLV
jgi:hypothetical protein